MRTILSRKIEGIEMNKEKLRFILEEVLETGISDYVDYRGGWSSTKEYMEARGQNIERNVNLILNLLEKEDE